MDIEGIVRADGLTVGEFKELEALTVQVRQRLVRTAHDILAIGADLIRAKEILGHGRFGDWLDETFALSRRSAEMFMAASRRFGERSEAVSHLPAGAVLELSSPSLPDDLVEEILSGQRPASVSAIRAARAVERSDERAYAVAETFIDHIERVRPTSGDFAAAIAAIVLRRWEEPNHRAWFARAMATTANLLEENVEMTVPTFEREKTTVRKMQESS